jgi:hypothetical protein
MLVSFMAGDCVFHISAGPDAGGARHVVAGSRGVSEWTFVGTRASDGRRVEVDGCDPCSFRGGKIRVTDSWHKSRG